MTTTTDDEPPPNSGRVMALDLGDARVGVALSDSTRTIAKAQGVVRRASRAEDFNRFGRLAADHDVALIVVGLPITLAGHEGDRAAWTRDYGSALAEAVGLPVIYWDESLTTMQAQESLRAQGRRGKKLKADVDAVAAALILQSYLDSQRPPPLVDEP
jgi:putative Holliday junction resolvase